MYDNAMSLLAHGYSIIPIASDKAAAVKWSPYQREPPDEQSIRDWFGDDRYAGIAIICGHVSGDLEMLEFEGRAVHEGLCHRFADLMTQAGHGTLASRIMSGYVERSPSGGIHLFFRIADAPVTGNTKLASRPATDDEMTPEETLRHRDTGTRPPRVLIETRGEGGYVIVAPSNGKTHPSGLPWTRLVGDPSTVPTITAADLMEIHRVCRTMDCLPDTPLLPDQFSSPRTSSMLPGDVHPGEDFNNRADWTDILIPAGWVAVRDDGLRTTWRRPGKSQGVSAMTGGPSGDYLYVFSTSTALPHEVGLSKWRAYALLYHGGDWSAAARSLRSQGYGSPLREPVRPAGVETAADRATESLTVSAGTTTLALAPERASERSDGTTLAHTEDGNAQCLVDRYGSVIRYVAEHGVWTQWTGERWMKSGADGGHIREYGKEVIRSLPSDDSKSLAHKRKSLSDHGITAMLNMARTHPGIFISISELDSHPYELNTPAGIVNLVTGECDRHDAAKLHTRCTLASPDREADSTVWLSFLNDTFGGQQDIIDYMQRLVGYSVVGQVREHVLPFCYGLGGNGKGVFLETINAVLGDYATVAPNHFLMAQRYTSHPTDLAQLAGARFVICSEINQSDKFDEAKIKGLTGGDSITARFMHKNNFTFVPTHTLWLMGNHQPAVESGGPSFWRRIRLIPFDNTISEKQQIVDLQGILSREHGASIMAWIIDGARAYMKEGLRDIESVKAATDQYAYEQDSLGRFIEDCCYIVSVDSVKTSCRRIRESYMRFCSEQDMTCLNVTAFGRAIRSRFGITQSRANGVRFYEKLALIQDQTSEETRH